jgi:hypothetical protein
MKKNCCFIFFYFLIFFSSLGQNNKPSYLLKIFEGKYDEVGIKCGYVNLNGDTIIPMGKYYYCYTDTLKYFAIVKKHNNGLVAIDKNEKELFEVYWYDNGPDNIVNGLFRIIKNGKIGYANSNGEIVIEPKFQCAYPFENEKAKVSLDCKSIIFGEHTKWESNKWYYIDKKGKEIK